MTRSGPGADGPGLAGAFDVIIVASWFPAYDDEAAGRFVADQAEALGATGVALPSVISFDGIRLSGGATARGVQEAAVTTATVSAVRRMEPLFVARGWGVDAAMPIARPAIAEGQTPATGHVHAARHREAVLGPIGDRLAAGGKRAGIVHAHTVYPDGAAAAVLADRLGWPLFITEHSSFVERIVATPGQREAYAGAVRRAARVFAVSEMLAGELRTAFPEVAERFAVLPNFVPVDLFRPADAADRRPDELLFVGYRKPTKGIENLLRAVAIARGRRPGITLRLLGRSPDDATEAAWRTLASELAISDAVRFEEPRDRAGIAEAMRRASLFVHPSPRETFGVVAVEALASGLPVVATDSGGVSEILGPDPDRLGALVARDDPEALATGILATLDRLENFDPAALRASVARRFGAASVAERLIVEYREALVRRPGVAAAEPGPPVVVAGSATAPERIVLVGMDRARAALRLGPLPADLRDRVVLLSAVEPDDVQLPSVGRVVTVAVEPPGSTARSAPAIARRPGLLGRIARLATDPVGTISRRMGRGAGSQAALEPASVALAALVAELGDTPVLPLDGHDHLVAAGAGRRGSVGLYPGGVRRLADEWHARGGPSGGSAASDR